MGGDSGPRIIVAALVKSLRKHPTVSALLFGDQKCLQDELSLCTEQSLISRIDVCHSPNIVASTDQPSVALRRKRDTSMGMALRAVADDRASACISSGNTGMLMALGMLELKTLPGIARPAICTTLPTSQGHSYILDLGANLDCSTQQLVEFALLGSLTAQALDGLTSPQVRLLNVGEEVSKGSEVIKATADLLSDEPLINYAGFVEGDGIFKGLADVVVCDGFTGNVALKSSEGVARMIGGMIRESMGSSWLSRLLSLFMAGTLRDLRRRLDPAAYNGAYLLGLTKVVVKSHGGADEQAFGHALDVAIEAAKRNLPEVLTPILQAKYQQQ